PGLRLKGETWHVEKRCKYCDNGWLRESTGTASPEISPASRGPAEFAAVPAPGWNESGSRSYHLSEDPAGASEKPPVPG
ncbi:MAG: hypothetical protein ABFS45_17090, partial [Pseudomonadota bacterium]